MEIVIRIFQGILLFWFAASFWSVAEPPPADMPVWILVILRIPMLVVGVVALFTFAWLVYEEWIKPFFRKAKRVGPPMSDADLQDAITEKPKPSSDNRQRYRSERAAKSRQQNESGPC